MHKKESPLIPSNYRGITITSVIGKLFNAIINSRLIKYLESHKLLRPEQIGFRKKCRTADHIFVINTLIKLYKQKQKPIFACFVDLKKAFDSISHASLLYKLLKLNMNGLVYKVIKNMYSNVNLQVLVQDGLTKTFTSNVGVRQGDNLSPTLFNIFINDLPQMLYEDHCYPLTLGNTSINCLLYADDLLILSENKAGLQNSLNKLNEYCKKWGLEANIQKTKVIIFNSKTKLTNKFYLGDEEISLVNEVSYLGMIISQTGSFTNTKSYLYKKGLKALFKLKRQIWPLPLIKTSMHLFNCIVKPILLYGSEVWVY